MCSATLHGLLLCKNQSNASVTFACLRGVDVGSCFGSCGHHLIHQAGVREKVIGVNTTALPWAGCCVPVLDISNSDAGVTLQRDSFAKQGERVFFSLPF